MRPVQKWIRHAKTVVLTLLVAGSLYLSYLMWHGDWQTPSEVGLTQVASTLPLSTSPTMSDVTAPYEIISTSLTPAGQSLSLPGTIAYVKWTGLAASLHIANLHPVASVPVMNAKAQFQVEFDFGTDIDHANLVKWFPNLSTSGLAVHGSEVTLYSSSSHGGPVLILIQNRTDQYVGETDLSSTAMASLCRTYVQAQPWTTWNAQSGGYVPTQSITVEKKTYNVNRQSILPFVHAFFVDPEVLTRIQENPHMVLWTDGSRAVQWDSAAQTATYQDPNATQGGTSYEPPLQTATGFIRIHGGAPAASIAFVNTDPQTDASVSKYTVITYVNGFPILGSTTTYDVEVRQGHIIYYRRPLWTLTTPISQHSVHTLSATAVQSIVHRLLPTTPISALTFQLGYRVTPGGAAGQEEVTLNPVYYVFQSGLLLWTLDAQTGRVLSGVKPS